MGRSSKVHFRLVQDEDGYPPVSVESVWAQPSTKAGGCSTEYIKAHTLLAVSIPSTVNLREVQGYLQAEASAGTLDYEEPILRQ